jgi:hypothetical protein
MSGLDATDVSIQVGHTRTSTSIVLTAARLAFESQIRVHSSDAQRHVSLWTLEYAMYWHQLNGGGGRYMLLSISSDR